MNIVGVIFDLNTDKQYQTVYYFKNFLDLNVDDLVVTDTRRGLSLGKVVELNCDTKNINSKNILKEVAGTVNIAAFVERQKKREKMTEIKAKMDKHVAIMQANAIYEMCAAHDPEMKALLDEYKELSK